MDKVKLVYEKTVKELNEKMKNIILIIIKIIILITMTIKKKIKKKKLIKIPKFKII